MNVKNKSTSKGNNLEQAADGDVMTDLELLLKELEPLLKKLSLEDRKDRLARLVRCAKMDDPIVIERSNMKVMLDLGLEMGRQIEELREGPEDENEDENEHINTVDV